MPLPTFAVPNVFDPRKLGNCQAWWDFSDSTRITLDGSSLVSTLADKIGSNNLTQTTASNRPALGNINGITCGDWGTSSSSKSLLSSLTGYAEVAVVCVYDYGSTFLDFNAILSNNSSGVMGFPSGAKQSWLTLPQGGLASDISVNGGASTDATRPAALPTIQSPCVVQSWGFSASSALRIGMDRTYAGRAWLGRIGEVVVFSSTLTASQRDWVRQGLRRKWRIAA